MAVYDVLAGISAVGLNEGFSQFFVKNGVHEKFFKGEIEKKDKGILIHLFWDIPQVPVFNLERPTEENWGKSVDEKGEKIGSGSMPETTMFSVKIPVLEFHTGQPKTAVKVEGLEFICGFDSTDGKVWATPLALYEGGSNLEPGDVAIFNLFLPDVFSKLRNLTHDGLVLPELPEDIFGSKVKMTKISSAVIGGCLVMAACKKGGGTVDFTGFSVPALPSDKSFFMLLNTGFVLESVTPKISEAAKRQNSGSYEDEDSGISANYIAEIEKVVSLTASKTDPTEVTAELEVFFKADIGTPVGSCAVEKAVRQ